MLLRTIARLEHNFLPETGIHPFIKNPSTGKKKVKKKSKKGTTSHEKPK